MPELTVGAKPTKKKLWPNLSQDYQKTPVTAMAVTGVILWLKNFFP
ncbi:MULTISPECIES: hypothetical protein [Microcystis]|nr:MULTISPECIES: hypothetical protein [Microcystis]